MKTMTFKKALELATERQLQENKWWDDLTKQLIDLCNQVDEENLPDSVGRFEVVPRLKAGHAVYIDHLMGIPRFPGQFKREMVFRVTEEERSLYGEGRSLSREKHPSVSEHVQRAREILADIVAQKLYPPADIDKATHQHP